MGLGGWGRRVWGGGKKNHSTKASSNAAGAGLRTGSRPWQSSALSKWTSLLVQVKQFCLNDFCQKSRNYYSLQNLIWKGPASLKESGTVADLPVDPKTRATQTQYCWYFGQGDVRDCPMKNSPRLYSPGELLTSSCPQSNCDGQKCLQPISNATREKHQLPLRKMVS